MLKKAHKFQGWEMRFFLTALLVLFTMGTAPLTLAGCTSSVTSTGPVTSSITEVPAALNNDVCYTCHKGSTLGITMQFTSSAMAQNDVTCTSCHVVAKDYPGAQAHYGTYRLIAPTPAMCQQCHAEKVSQFVQGRHSLPSHVAVFGTSDLTADQLAMYKAIPEGGYDPAKTEHPLAAIEGPDIVPFACEACHKIGQPNVDGSVGRCQSCHLTHSFSLEQARKPETCNACHIGPDHPQWEIYQESPHGIRYATDGQNWNWKAAAGTLTVKDMPAPTCATCHISSFGNVPGSHDPGNRLTYFLAAQFSAARPDAQANAGRMQTVCLQCHAVSFVLRFYDSANQLTTTVNEMMKEADVVMAPLKAQGLVSAVPFDEPIKFIYFDIWHDYGRTTKFGAWMQGPDYSQWHGVYEILRNMAELKAMAADKLAAAK